MNNRIVMRPVRVTILAILIFCVSAWNAIRLGESVFFWKTLLEYGASPVYLMLSGFVWLAVSLLLVWGSWQGKHWAWLGVCVGAPVYAIWYWVDRLLLQTPHANWPYALIVTVFFLLLFLGILFSRRTRRFFIKDTNERKPKDTTPS